MATMRPMVWHRILVGQAWVFMSKSCSVNALLSVRYHSYFERRCFRRSVGKRRYER
jgi:hypothetical protein